MKARPRCGEKWEYPTKWWRYGGCPGKTHVVIAGLPHRCDRMAGHTGPCWCECGDEKDRPDLPMART